MRSVATSLVLLVAAFPTLACEPPALDRARRMEGARHVVTFRSTPAPLPLNASFGLDIAICAKDGSAVPAPRIEASMPAHRHGMNYRPRLTETQKGLFRADGLLFHMPGRWELVFEVAGERLTATHDLD